MEPISASRRITQRTVARLSVAGQGIVRLKGIGRALATVSVGLLALVLLASAPPQTEQHPDRDTRGTAQEERRSDRDIRRDIVRALRAEPELNVGDVRVEVDDGRVVLSGSVPKWKHRQLAEEVTRNVEGVRAVVNELRTEDDPDRPDDEIRAEIIRNLEDDPQVDASTIEVKVVDGAVRLRGTVGSVAEKNRAYGAASVQGVESVDATHLEIREDRGGAAAG